MRAVNFTGSKESVSGGKIKPLVPKRLPQSYLSEEGRFTLSPSPQQYVDMSGMQFLRDWMKSSRYQDMMGGKEFFTAERDGGHAPLRYAFPDEGDPRGRIETNLPDEERRGPGETNLIKVAGRSYGGDISSSVVWDPYDTTEYLTEEELYQRFADLGYGDNPTITDMRNRNLDEAVVTDKPSNENVSFAKGNRPVVQLDSEEWTEFLAGESDDPNFTRLSLHELSHASDTHIHDLNSPFILGRDKVHTIDEIGAGNYYFLENDAALIPTQDEQFIRDLGRENEEEARRRKSEGEALGRYAPWDDEYYARMLYGVDYYTNPTEVRSRLNVIRKLAGETGVLDPFNEEFTMEDLQQMYDDMNENVERRREFVGGRVGMKKDIQRAGKYKPIQELNKFFTKEQILKMLNEIAYNEPSDNGIDFPRT